MRWLLIFTLTCFLCTAQGCSDTGRSADGRQKLTRLSWLEGVWQNVDDSVVATEVWTKQNDSLYTGMSYSLKGADTLFAEQLSLQAKGYELYYVPVVKGQNRDLPVSFVLVSDSAGIFTFENKDHDFPQRIVYTHPSPDSVFAWIEGEKNGQNKRIGFPMKRISN